MRASNLSDTTRGGGGGDHYQYSELNLIPDFANTAHADFARFVLPCSFAYLHSTRHTITLIKMYSV